MKVDLNCDLGESFGNYRCGMDEEVLPYISSANIACGFHASDPVVMEKTVAMAKSLGVGIGAHPGFPDLQGFGRRNMAVSKAEVRAMVLYQVGALSAFCKANKTYIAHVKPHGALYNMAVRDRNLADGICEAICELDPALILLAPAGSELEQAAKAHGIQFAKEVFADRAYEEDGTLVARTKAGAMITDELEAIDRVVRMIKERKVQAITGKDIEVQVDSICVHGDGEKAVAFVRAIRARLEQEGIEIRTLKEKTENVCERNHEAVH